MQHNNLTTTPTSVNMIDTKNKVWRNECTSQSSCSVHVSAHNLKTTDFPACASRCAFIDAMGVGECESACPWKFDKDGNPVAQNAEAETSERSEA